MKHCPRCNYPNPDSRETCFDCHTSLDSQPVLDSETGLFGYPEGTLLCKRCFAPAVRDDHETPLCAACRKSLTKYCLPKWALACCAVVGVTMVYSLMLLPGSMKPAVLFERGRRAEAARDFQAAVAQYRLVQQRYPKSTTILGRIGICQCKMQDVAGAMDTLKLLNGQGVTPGLADELESAAHDLPGVSVRRKE
jgi:hypothetical protein